MQHAAGRAVRLVNPAVNGFTTIDVLAKEVGFIAELEPNLVSVLAGVNDLVRGRAVDAYRSSVAEIYDAVATLRLPRGRVAAISIPEWSIAPAAEAFGDPARLHAMTTDFNSAARAEAEERRFTWIDITGVSRAADRDVDWYSADELHPGDRQYAAWAEEIWSRVRDAWSSA